MSLQKLLSLLPDLLSLALPLLGYFVFGWPVTLALIALIFSLGFETVFAILFSSISLGHWLGGALGSTSALWRKIKFIFEFFSELFLAFGANVLFFFALGGLFLLPPTFLEDPYLMNNTAYDGAFFARLFHIQEQSGWLWFVTLLLLFVPAIKRFVQELRAGRYRSGETRILLWYFPQRNMASFSPEHAPLFVGASLACGILYAIAFSHEYIGALLCVIYVWRIFLVFFEAFFTKKPAPNASQKV